MPSFPVASPPNAPGIYLLCNRTAKIFYVGKTVNLRRRWIEWRGAFNNQANLRSEVFIEIIKTTDPIDWDFEIVQDLTNVDPKRGSELENQTIETLRAMKVGTILNDFAPHGVRPRPSSRSTVRDNGETLTIAEAARRLGCMPKTLAKRLKQWRVKGKYEWTINELRR
jgi:hypothetical protein